MRWNSTIWIGLLILAAGLGSALMQRLSEEELIGPATAIDGDSLRILDRQIRLQGIDAPELRQTCRGAGGEIACGRDARRALDALVARGMVRCLVSGRDRFRRDLARCRMGDLDVNAEMVRAGRAIAFGDFQAEENEARAARRGVWATTFERPAEWRAKHPRGPDS